MTKSQEISIRKIRDLAEKRCDRRYETKKWDVTEFRTFVSVVLCMGAVEDRNAPADFVPWDYAHFFVGLRGGVTFPVTKNEKTVYRRFKWDGVQKVIEDQKANFNRS